MSTSTLTQEHAGERMFEPRYDLSDLEMNGLTQDFLATQEDLSGRYACFRVDSQSALGNVARTVECRVFDETFGNNPSQMHEGYGQYEDASHFLLVVDRKLQTPAGVVRFIFNSDAGLKSVNDLEKPLGITKESFLERQQLESFDDCLDVGTLAVLPQYRGLDNRFAVSTMLYRGMFLLGKQEQAQNLVTIIDKQARKGVDFLGIPLKEVNGTGEFSYMGSPGSFAMHGVFPDFEPAVLARNDVLQSRAAITAGNIIKPLRFLKNRAIAKVAGSLATGEGIDSNMRI